MRIPRSGRAGYKRSQDLQSSMVGTFIISSKTPNKRFLKKFGYAVTKKQGVYKSDNPMLEALTLLSLNELENKPCNTFVKCFASRKKEKKAAFKNIYDAGMSSLNLHLQWFIRGLWGSWFQFGGENMDIEKELTPEIVMGIGKMWGESYLKSLPVKERLAGLKPKERLAGLKPKERLAGLKPEERLAGLKPKERLAGLKPKEILDKLSTEDIENYLKNAKRKGSA